MLEAHLEAARGHGEFGAQQIPVSLDFLHRLGKGGLSPPRRQSYSAIVNERHDSHSDEGRKQETDPHVHHRFDHLSETVIAVILFLGCTLPA